MKPVGILGGMGPEATILLMQKVLACVQAGDDADHIPLIVHQNPQVPSRIAALIDGTGPDPAPALRRMALDLEAAGAQALAMPCNTAHHYAQVVDSANSLPFLNMLDLTARHLAAKGAKNIGMLASPATRLTGVFNDAFTANGLTPVWRDGNELLSIIRAVKAGADSASIAPRITTEAQSLIRSGADHLLIACTELSLFTHALPNDVRWTDSLDCLVTAIAGFARG